MWHPPAHEAGRGAGILTDPEGVTLVVTRIVSSGRSDDHDRWAEAVDRALGEAPGHVSTARLEQDGGVVHRVTRFASAADLAAWDRSDVGSRLKAEGADFSNVRRQEARGPVATFRLPGENSGSKWKKWLLTWVAVFPVLLALNALVSLIPGLPSLARLAITSPILTALLTWFILPRVTRWAKPWVLGDSDGRPRKP